MINIKNLETSIDIHEIGGTIFQQSTWIKGDYHNVMHETDYNLPLIITKARINKNDFALRVRFYVSIN